MPSSLKLMSLTPINSQCKKKILTIWQSIRHNNDSVQFRNPVKWQEMGLYDYLDYVKQPMDLSTIQKKLKQQKYRTVQNFLDDMQLIFDNCKTYNTSGCWIYNLADKLQKSFIKMVRNFLPKIAKTNSHSKLSQDYGKKKLKEQPLKEQLEQIDDQYLEQICYNQKIKFIEKFSHLNQQNIQKVAEVILKKCSKALGETIQQKPKKEIKQSKTQSNNILQAENVLKNQQAQNLEQIPQAEQIIAQQNKIESKEIKNSIKNVENLRELQIGTKFQILVDELNLETFRQLMELMEHMIEEKDKSSKKIKLQ